MPIDYARMQKSGPKLKAMLTRAQKKGYNTVMAACVAAVVEWNQVGAWPDNWSLWQRALDDAAHKHNRNRTASGDWSEPVYAPRLEGLTL